MHEKTIFFSDSPSSTLVQGDKIFLSGLKTRAIIGIYDWERKAPQPIQIDMVFPCDCAKASKSDQMEDSINYKEISKTTLSFIEKSNFSLIETLAEKLAETCLSSFPLSWVHLRVSKPGAIRHAENVGVEITRYATKKEKT